MGKGEEKMLSYLYFSRHCDKSSHTYHLSPGERGNRLLLIISICLKLSVAGEGAWFREHS